ncbi:transcription factor Adf-1-like isoform X2 [Bactrocera neohumeralis]|uniref:transcription factor Adf-1-like isoform X2 n=1 Tax=Bactrocera neohumeralis TaxID=98809 RepID=UPI002165F29E|nr:transcription factor Adf-1-like isoform X2 [Bactrocera neohumeralis]
MQNGQLRCFVYMPAIVFLKFERLVYLRKYISDFSMDLDEVLIEEVRNCPLIFDVSHRDYKNLRKKEMTWKQISTNTRLSECKKRWKSLRDSYKRCKRMEQVASGSGQQTPRRKWRYLEAMSFMEKIPNSRRTISSISEDFESVQDNIIIEHLRMDVDKRKRTGMRSQNSLKRQARAYAQ